VDHNMTAPFMLTLPAGAALRVTLAWDDPPAVELASPALVNDLDLVVLDPANVRWFPWTLDPNTPSADAVRTREDHINNVEQVAVDAPARSGTWRIDVRGTSVPQGPQRFSLVYQFIRSTAPSPPSNLRITP
jgi:hypothetical protein